MKAYLRRDLSSFEPYAVEDCAYIHKMDANESPFPLPEAVKEKFMQWFTTDSLQVYPDASCLQIREKIAKQYNLKAENCLCAVGSDQLIEFLSKAFLEPGDFVLVPSPSFSMYGITTVLNHGQALPIPLTKTEDDFMYPVDQWIHHAKVKKPKIIYICSPNNPTGSIIPMESIRILLEHVSCPVVVDEAYGEFQSESAVSLIAQYKNLMVLRTFSKAYGIAGARLGYALAQKEAIDCLSLVCPPYHLNSMSQRLAEFLLYEQPALAERVSFLQAERDRLTQAMKQYDFIKPFRSHANFIYFESPFDIAAIMKESGILIRGFGTQDNGLTAARVSVGTKEANQAFLQCLDDAPLSGTMRLFLRKQVEESCK